MKRSHCISFLLILFSFSPYLNAAILFDGIISYWPFDRGMGNFALDVVTANDGRMSGPQWTEGVDNLALQFDGENDYIRVPDNVSLRQNSQSWSVGFWMKSDISNQSSMIVSKRQNTRPHEQYSVGIATKNSHTWPIGKKITFLFRQEPGREKGGYTTDDIDFSEWTQVFVVLDKNENTVKVFINGSEVSVTIDHDGSFPIIDNIDNLFIGGNPDALDLYNGELDDVCIYNRALTAGEISLLYKYHAADPIPATVQIVPSNLNLSGYGQWVSAKFSLPREYNICDVEAGSIFLEGGLYPSWSMCNENSNNITAKFNRKLLLQHLEIGENELLFNARLTDGTPILGKVTLNVVD